MARAKQRAPLQRETSKRMENWRDSNALPKAQANGHSKEGVDRGGGGEGGRGAAVQMPQDSPGVVQLLICVGGIYASFLSWALLQERITTTSYAGQRFTFSIVLNTIQSTFAALSGLAYLYLSTPPAARLPSIFPTARVLFPLILVAVTSSLASPFGYAALAHVDYITFILAKSCKLLPVMALHVALFRRRYPLYKYLVVGLVTAGVALFTLHSKKAGRASSGPTGNSSWGLFLLGVNLLFDGLTNSTQDHIFTAYQPYSGPQMMVAQNVLATLLTGAYLLLLPLLPDAQLGAVGIPPSSAAELSDAYAFLVLHPEVLKDVLGFAACGAVGQIFIYATLSRFSSLLLVTVTVTRKMLSMVLSVLWFGHSLSGMQWLGVGLVFGGVGFEGLISRREKLKKDGEKKAAAGRTKKEL